MLRASGANYRQAKVAKWLRQSRGVRRIINSTPSAKVVSSQAFKQHIAHNLQHHSTVSLHFYARRYKTLRWCTYIRRQRAMANMCSGCHRQQRCHSSGLRQRRFAHNSKGRVSSLTKGFKSKLGESCHFFEVDEHRTGRLCCACNDANGMPGMGLGTGEIVQAIMCIYE